VGELVRRAVHVQRLLRHLTRFAVATGATWIVPLVLLLVLFVGLAATTQVVAPYVVYTFF